MELEKIGKNLFRMFRDEKVTSQDFTVKFKQLKKRLDARGTIRLDSEYHQRLEAYIQRLYHDTVMQDTFADGQLGDIREVEMSNLNRLQKLKNASGYKKEKHKTKKQHEDWG